MTGLVVILLCLNVSSTPRLFLLGQCWLKKAIGCSLRSGPSLQSPGQQLAGPQQIFSLSVNFLEHVYKPLGILMPTLSALFLAKFMCVPS